MIDVSMGPGIAGHLRDVNSSYSLDVWVRSDPPVQPRCLEVIRKGTVTVLHENDPQGVAGASAAFGVAGGPTYTSDFDETINLPNPVLGSSTNFSAWPSIEYRRIYSESGNASVEASRKTCVIGCFPEAVHLRPAVEGVITALVESGPTECCPADPQLPSWGPSFGSPDPLACQLVNNNCFNYALNRDENDHKQPGGGIEQCTCSAVAAKAAVNGVIPASSPQCLLCSCPIALWVRPPLLLPNGQTLRSCDFHWWRKNQDGTWSDKHGCEGAESEGARDPQRGDLDGDYSFCGFYCAPCGPGISADFESAILEPEAGNEITIVPKTFSGIPNYVWVLSDPGLTKVLSALADKLQPTSACIDDYIGLSSRLGYSGFAVEGLSTSSGLQVVDVHNGFALVRSLVSEAKILVYTDPDRALEDALKMRSIGLGSYPLDLSPNAGFALTDFQRFEGCFVSQSPQGRPYCSQYDFDRDGKTDLYDFSIFQQSFGE